MPSVRYKSTHQLAWRRLLEEKPDGWPYVPIRVQSFWRLPKIKCTIRIQAQHQPYTVLHYREPSDLKAWFGFQGRSRSTLSWGDCMGCISHSWDAVCGKLSSSVLAKGRKTSNRDSEPCLWAPSFSRTLLHNPNPKILWPSLPAHMFNIMRQYAGHLFCFTIEAGGL